MKKYILILSVLLVSCAGTAWAKSPVAKPAEKPVAVQEQSEAVPEINQEDLKKLVETLESETARTEFIGNLKTLMQQQETEKAKVDEAGLPLSEQIGVRNFFSDGVAEYQGFLGRHNLSGSIVNQSLGSIIVLAVMLVLLILQKRLNKKLLTMSDKFGSKIEVSMKGLRFHIRMFNIFSKVIILLVTLYTLAKIWGVGAADQLLGSDVARNAISNGLTVLVILFLAALAWEAINIYLESVLRKANTNNQSRTKTLLPIIRNIIIAVFAALFGLVLLSELGINVTPLLAGAGVIGVAVGFGAQSFVKDFLSGFTIILEDIVRVGDVVNLGGASGSVEKITLRKIQLRDFAGTVYTIPYSEIKTIQNLTKDFSYYVMDIGVPYTQNIDRVIAALRAVDEEMRKDDSFSFMILEPLEIAGVDKFAEGAVVIKARIKTQPIRQWTVGREFNKRMKIEFEKDGIEMPLAQRTVNVRSLDAKAPTAEALLEAAAAADRSQS
jgi:small conductance mechanosensitive channel